VRRRAGVAAVVALIVVSPALRGDVGDSFPLSTFPMFSHDRDRVASVATAVGIDAGGEAHRLRPHAIGGGDEPMLAVSAARGAVDGGEAAAARYCREVAERVTERSGITAVEVRTEVRDAVDDVDADGEPLDVVVHARCDVP